MLALKFKCSFSAFIIYSLAVKESVVVILSCTFVLM